VSLHVELVSPERQIWAGDAEMVVARTLEGEIGILRGHSPVLGVLLDGSVVRVKLPGEEEDEVTAMVSGGFFSVADDEVSVLAEYAELGSEIDVDEARQQYERASAAEGDEAAVERRRAEARLRAAGVEV
jgi:F-type H+-transporting ATPase subunit epsilon